jgi:hypothetical protein
MFFCWEKIMDSQSGIKRARLKEQPEIDAELPNLILRSGRFAASRTMRAARRVVRDGADAPPHHEALDCP